MNFWNYDVINSDNEFRIDKLNYQDFEDFAHVQGAFDFVKKWDEQLTNDYLVHDIKSPNQESCGP